MTDETARFSTGDPFIVNHQPRTIDPDNVPETLCLGMFNISFSVAGLATLTFTHIRPKPGPLIDGNQVEDESVVRARIVTTPDNLIALRDVLNNVLKNVPAATAVSGGAGGLN
jgi:hypothetical protein